MIRTLIIIAVAGFLVSAVTLSVAVALTGPDAIAHGAWTWGPHGWRWRHHAGFGADRDQGPHATREIAWPGGETLAVSVPAEIDYTQSDGPAKIVITGPSRLIENVTVDGGHIRYVDDGAHDDEKLTIAVTAPSVSDFALEGSETLSIRDYRQDRLSVEVTGYGDVKAAGVSRDLQVSISGAGHADLAGLAEKAAKVEISGAGDASIGPTDSADVDISGAGSVTLLSNPPQLHTNISGLGRIHRAGL